MSWLMTLVSTIVAYALFSYFGLRSGEQETVARAALAPVRSPLDFGLILFGSIGFGLATFFGSRASPHAVSIVISLGVIVSFIVSILLADGTLNGKSLVGILLVLAGIWFIQ